MLCTRAWSRIAVWYIQYRMQCNFHDLRSHSTTKSMQLSYVSLFDSAYQYHWIAHAPPSSQVDARPSGMVTLKSTIYQASETTQELGLPEYELLTVVSVWTRVLNRPPHPCLEGFADGYVGDGVDDGDILNMATMLSTRDALITLGVSMGRPEMSCSPRALACDRQSCRCGTSPHRQQRTSAGDRRCPRTGSRGRHRRCSCSRHRRPLLLPRWGRPGL
jgi:hypothetical protein